MDLRIKEYFIKDIITVKGKSKVFFGELTNREKFYGNESGFNFTDENTYNYYLENPEKITLLDNFKFKTIGNYKNYFKLIKQFSKEDFEYFDFWIFR